MISERPADYLLIDGVLRPEALARLQGYHEPLEVVPLYAGTRWAELSDLGPILVRAPAHSTLLQHASTADNGWANSVSLLYSTQPMKVVAEHLRHFIAPPDTLGGTGLLRFADPLVAHFWLGSYPAVHLDEVLGPLDAWQVPEPHHAWVVCDATGWRTFVRTAAPPTWADDHARLSHAQLEALGNAGRWRFIERLYAQLVQYFAPSLTARDQRTLAQWFDARLDDGEAWGLTTERGLVIWLKYSLRWGDDFTEPPHSPYRRWLAHNPEALRLPADQRMRRLDDHCLAIELDKDAT